MRTLFNLISFLALVNLLALLMLVGWLWQSGRLDRERLLEVRSILALPVDEARALRDAASREQQQSADEAQAAQRQENRPLPSDAQLRQELEDSTRDHLASRRVAEDQRQLREQLEVAMRAIAEREEKLEQTRQAWREATAGKIDEIEAEQFAKTVGLLQSLPPKQAKTALFVLIESGSSERAVAYLDAMPRRSASKILAEFKSDAEARLATELLERLSRFGLPTDAQEKPVDAPTAPDPDQADVRGAGRAAGGGAEATIPRGTGRELLGRAEAADRPSS